MEKTLSNIKLIVVHGGFTSHQDERIACGLAYMAGARVRIERRDPTQDELNDPDILVMDVGMKYSPLDRNFDHHQLTAQDGETPETAYSLLAKDLKVEEAMEALYPWYTTGRWVDVKGPFKAAEICGAEWPKIEGFMGPSEHLNAQKWAQNDMFRHDLSQEYATAWETEISAFLDYKDMPNLEEHNGLRVIFTDHITDKGFRAVSLPIAKYHRADVLVGRDDRGGGLSIMRLGDSVPVDFRLVQDDPSVGFVHKDSGFILKTIAGVTSREAAFNLIEKSIK